MVTVHKLCDITSLAVYLSIFDEETCYHFLCHFIHICDLVVPCHIFLFEVLSLQVFFTVCFLKFILSCILNFGQIELHNAATPWGLLPSHYIASRKVRDIPEKVDRRIRTWVNFIIVWLKLFVFVWLKRIICRDGSMGTGACGTGAWRTRTWETGACG